MAYINGKEILFSPNINITVGENYVLSDEDIEKIAQVLLENLTIEQQVNDSTNPVSSKAVQNEIRRTLDYCDEEIGRAKEDVAQELADFSNAYDQIIEGKIAEANQYTDEKIGDIETALDTIIAIQNSLIGGDA